nr:PRC-barrel domain-containing protein [Solimicrobium silvestre]
MLDALENETIAINQNDPIAINQNEPIPPLMGAKTLIGNKVSNAQDEHLGDIKEIMLNMHSGSIAYAVLAHGGVLTMGEKLFAVPWNSMKLDPENHQFILNISKERFENAPGFDSNHWPNMADHIWVDSIQGYYFQRTYE